MLTATPVKPLSPYRWCTSHPKAAPDDLVVMTEPDGTVTTFTIVSIDDGKVHWSLPGVWINRVWIEMAKDCTYELFTKGE